MSEQPDKAPRRQRRKDDRPGEIIAAGLAEFARNGFAATRLSDIARRAGVAKGTIYRYFDSKEALFEAAVRSRVIGSMDEVQSMIAAHDGPTEQLLAALLDKIYAEFVGSDVAILMRILIGEGHRFPKLVAFYHREALSQGQDVLGQIVARGIERGEIAATPAATEPRLIMAPAFMAAIWEATFGAIAPLDRARFREAHLDMLTRGLLNRQAAE